MMLHVGPAETAKRVASFERCQRNRTDCIPSNPPPAPCQDFQYLQNFDCQDVLIVDNLSRPPGKGVDFVLNNRETKSKHKSNVVSFGAKEWYRHAEPHSGEAAC